MLSIHGLIQHVASKMTVPRVSIFTVIVVSSFCATCSAQTFPEPGISFTVDDQSIGLIPAQSPFNNVRDDAGLPQQQLTVYRNHSPFENERTNQLTGVVGGAANNFRAGDVISSMSNGQDGTFTLSGQPGPGALYFSVDRISQGQLGTDVNLDAMAGVPKQASGIYVSGVNSFGSYRDPSGLSGVPMNDNFLVVDPTMIGLRPSLSDTAQDNITGLELDPFAQNDL